MSRKAALVEQDRVLRSIMVIRKQKVILDADLAELYKVPTKALVQAVKRNITRFPADFMFQLNAREFQSLRSQIVTSNIRGGRRTAPYAFTEEGVAMLSSVLHSKRAVAVNVEIMRAFVRLRGIAAEHRDLAEKIVELEKRYDATFQAVFETMRGLMAPDAEPKRRRIGYLAAGTPPTT